MFNLDLVSDVYSAAKNIFCNGIYVKSNAHPCGWDFISFEFASSVKDMFKEEVQVEDISGGCYNYHDYEGKSVAEILSIVGEKGYCFEINNADELR